MGLVEEASAFGSAGIFTCCVMGLLQSRGGALTASVSMIVGMATYGVLAYVVQYDYAYLASLAGSFGSYLLVMFVDSNRNQQQDLALNSGF
jgi:uncharacterized sodium:solute symporter family permease YidK